MTKPFLGGLDGFARPWLGCYPAAAVALPQPSAISSFSTDRPVEVEAVPTAVVMVAIAMSAQVEAEAEAEVEAEVEVAC